MARRWVEFSRDVLQPAYPWWSDWLRVTGTTTSGIAHAHVVWFGEYVPHDWLVINWGRHSGGDDAVWLDEVKGRNGAGVSKYLSRQFVEYLAGQGVRARWSCSTGWRSPGGERGDPAVRVPTSTVGKAALEFVAGVWYRGHDGPWPSIHADASGDLHSFESVGDILRRLR